MLHGTCPIVYLSITNQGASLCLFVHVHLPYSEDGVDLVELVAFEAQLFPHTRDVRIVEIGAVKIIQEVHKTAKSKDEEVKLLYELALAWRILVASKIGDKAVDHLELRS
jgi:hypothetical protein